MPDPQATQIQVTPKQDDVSISKTETPCETELGNGIEVHPSPFAIKNCIFLCTDVRHEVSDLRHRSSGTVSVT